MNPEDELPDPSLLTKFRKLRLREFLLDDILTEIVRQCVENGVIKSGNISIDTTHTEANTVKKVPERIMKLLAKRIFTALEKDLGTIPAEINTNIPNYKKIADHKEAKQTMKDYLEGAMAKAAPLGKEETTATIAEAKEILSDERFILQKGLRSFVDRDARVGRKSKTRRISEKIFWIQSRKIKLRHIYRLAQAHIRSMKKCTAIIRTLMSGFALWEIILSKRNGKQHKNVVEHMNHFATPLIKSNV